MISEPSELTIRKVLLLGGNKLDFKTNETLLMTTIEFTVSKDRFSCPVIKYIVMIPQHHYHFTQVNQTFNFLAFFCLKPDPLILESGYCENFSSCCVHHVYHFQTYRGKNLENLQRLFSLAGGGRRKKGSMHYRTGERILENFNLHVIFN